MFSSNKYCISSLLIVIVLMSFLTVPGFTQEEASIYFTGIRSGEATSQRAVFRLANSSAEEQISAADTDVLLFHISSSNAILAYAANVDDEPVLDIVQLSTLTSQRLTLPALIGRVTKIWAFDDFVWIATHTEDRMTQLLGVDVVANQLITDHTFDEINTQVNLHPNGRWALTYEEMGRVSVLALPSLAALPVDIDGWVVSSPRWLLNSDSFFMLTSQTIEREGVVANIVEIDNGTIRIPVPDLVGENVYAVSSSNTGRFIAYTSRTTDEIGIGGEFTLSVVDLDTSSVSQFRETGTLLSIEDWSADDRHVIVFQQPLQELENAFVPLEISIFDSQTKTVRPLESTRGLGFSAIAWQPDGAVFSTLGVTLDIAENRVNENDYQIVMIDPDADTIVNEIMINDPNLLRSRLFWERPQESLIFATTVDDTSASLGTVNGLFAVGNASNELTRLTVADVNVDATSVTIR